MPMKNYMINNISLILTFLAVYFAPAYPIMIGIGFLVTMDFITGILAAKKRGEIITSKKMRPTIMKGFGYMASILIAFIMQNIFLTDMEVMKIVSGLVAMIELKSLDENLTDITGKSIFKQFLKDK
jgi:phage-related holin